MTQSTYGFGVDSTVYPGYAQATSSRLGTFSLIVENTGSNTLKLQVGEQDGVTAPSGYAMVGSAFVVVPGGQQTKTFSSNSKRLAFFGSGNTLPNLTGSPAGTSANITVVFNNPANLEGRQIDLCTVGHNGWVYDQAFDSNTCAKQWPVLNTGNASGMVVPAPVTPTGVATGIADANTTGNSSGENA